MRVSTKERGSTPAELIVGAGLGLIALTCALSLVQGSLKLGDASLDAEEAREGGRWALERIAEDVERAGLGVGPEMAVAGPDEAIELLTQRSLAVRGDLDRDRPGEARVPEDALAGHFPRVATANDEVLVFLRRAGPRGGPARALFEADLDGPDTSVVGGIPVAARDGLVETIDAGPHAARAGEPGTLYRVHFVHDARRAGTGRFRVLRPLLDEVLDFRVDARDSAGAAVAACGGADDPAARACRASVRDLRLVLVVSSRGGPQQVERRVVLAAPGRIP